MTQLQKEISKKYFEEAIKFYKNGKGILKKAKVEYRTYKSTKLAAEACGIAYLAALKTLDGYLIQRGVEERELPQSYYEYVKFLNKYLVHNGKVKSALTVAYQNLHILGYYRGGVNVDMIKAGFASAKFIIENLSRGKI